jgi:hypothetical protein
MQYSSWVSVLYLCADGLKTTLCSSKMFIVGFQILTAVVMKLEAKNKPSKEPG